MLMQADHANSSYAKKWAVKLGGPHRPFNLPTEGGVFHRKATVGSELWTRPPESVAGGGDIAADTLHLC